MTDPARPHTAGQPETVDEARAEIDRTREQLGATVHALAQKADLKAQARRKLDETRARVGAKAAALQTSVSEASPQGTDPAAALKQAVERLIAAARANPQAALAVAAVVGFLLGRSARRRSS